ncbi:MAG TPA: division/cell wall cluster transcriptional repressor MraZ [Longimicrobiales bacterium]
MRRMKFLGSYTYQLDDKGRVSLPAPFRNVAADQRFVLIQVTPPALSLYPETEWVKVEERLSEMMRRQPEARTFLLNVLANAVEVSPDGQGRILIPATLREQGKLNGQVQMIGAIDRIEIWNPAEFQAATAHSSGEFAQFLPQIFG